MISGLILASVLASQAGAAPVSGFTVVIEEEPTYYDVEGRTSAELSKAMETSGVVDEADGYRGAAGTASAVTVRFAREMKDGRCVLKGAKVTVSVVMRLPRWKAPDDAEASVKDWWRKAAAAIRGHEDGHQQIDVEAGRNVLNYIQDVPPETSCDKLDDRVNAEILRGQDEEFRNNVEYDKRTKHGKTQYGEFLKP
jgi:predicted secreted Zn-dependent protease